MGRCSCSSATRTRPSAGVGIAVAGIIRIAGVLALGARLGALPAAAAALLLALSPTLIAASRSMDGGVLIVTLSVLLFAAAMYASRSHSLVYAVLAGMLLAMLLLAGPLGLPAAVIAIVGIFLAAGIVKHAPDCPTERRTAAGFAAARSCFFSSALLTQPSSIIEAPLESLSILWDDHLDDRRRHPATALESTHQ
ncbi:MAG: hypothetical protein R3A46_06705 [Thermomicrobiales bacterium]